jgi:hypothetical protein
VTSQAGHAIQGRTGYSPTCVVLFDGRIGG